MINSIRRWLAEGDLSSDGRANDVVQVVIEDPSKFDDLVALLDDEDQVVRGHAADALEKIAREKPEYFLPYMHVFLTAALEDSVPMVQWHLAMIFAHLALFSEVNNLTIPALINLLEKENVLTKIWAVTSLSIIGRLYPHYQTEIVGLLAELKDAPQPSLSKRIKKALEIILEEAPFPAGWVKSRFIEAKLDLSSS